MSTEDCPQHQKLTFPKGYTRRSLTNTEQVKPTMKVIEIEKGLI